MYANKRGKWESEFTYAAKRHRLGAFRTKEEAAAAYDAAARQHIGNKRGVLYAYNFESAEAGEAAAAAAAAAVELAAPPQLKPRPRPKSGYYGVRANGKNWQAETHAGKYLYLGTFRTKEEAAVAYDAETRQHRSNKSGGLYNFDSAEAGEAAAAAALAAAAAVESEVVAEAAA